MGLGAKDWVSRDVNLLGVVLGLCRARDGTPSHEPQSGSFRELAVSALCLHAPSHLDMLSTGQPQWDCHKRLSSEQENMYMCCVPAFCTDPHHTFGGRPGHTFPPQTTCTLRSSHEPIMAALPLHLLRYVCGYRPPWQPQSQSKVLTGQAFSEGNLQLIEFPVDAPRSPPSSDVRTMVPTNWLP